MARKSKSNFSAYNAFLREAKRSLHVSHKQAQKLYRDARPSFDKMPRGADIRRNRPLFRSLLGKPALPPAAAPGAGAGGGAQQAGGGAGYIPPEMADMGDWWDGYEAEEEQEYF